MRHAATSNHLVNNIMYTLEQDELVLGFIHYSVRHVVPF
jgi:hypothetical protein